MSTSKAAVDFNDGEHWTKLSNFPYKYFAAPLPLNDNEFIVAPDKAADCQSNCLYKFNTKQNKWIEWIEHPKIPNYRSDYPCCVRDAINNKIYSWCQTISNNI